MVNRLSYDKGKVLRTIGHKLRIMSYDWEGTTSFDNPQEVKTYLSDNMAEGYLADEEEAFIEALVERYEELLELEEDVQDLVRTIQNNKVN